MAGLLKAVENGYRPTPRDVANELEEIPFEQGYWPFGASACGASNREEFIEKLFKLLGVSQ